MFRSAEHITAVKYLTLTAGGRNYRYKHSLDEETEIEAMSLFEGKSSKHADNASCEGVSTG